MGIINHDTYETIYGATIIDTYINIGSGSISVRKEGDKYIYNFIYFIYVSKASKNEGKVHISDLVIEKIYNSVQSKEIYSLAYDVLKEVFPNSSDD